MSGTFTQPSSPTSGLQNYKIEGSVKNLYYVPRFNPVLKALKSRRRNQAAAFSRTKSLRKGLPPMFETLEKMASTLTSSVETIIAAGGDQQALAETQAQFARAVQGFVDGELAKVAPDDLEPMFKGLGTVSRTASIVSQMASSVQNAKDGKEWSGSDKVSDPASEQVCDMLDAALHCAELALRFAVNEHVEIAEPDELDSPMDGMAYMKLADPTDPDNRELDQLIKSALPSDLLAFATDPAELAMGMTTFGAEILAKTGIPENILEKLFSDEGLELLEKAAPFDPNADPNAMGAGDPNADPNADPSLDGDDGSGDGDDPVDVLGRILAAGMIQLDLIRQIMEGGDPGAADPGSADPADPNIGDATNDPAGAANVGAPDPADPNATAGGAPPAPAKKKNPFAKLAPGGALAKLAGSAEIAVDPATLSILEKVATSSEASDARVASLASAVDKLTGVVGTMASQLQPPKGPIGQAHLGTLEKSADGHGQAPNDLDLDQEANRLAKLAPEDRALALTKLAHRSGGALV
jgi:hypothetical protein